MPTCAGFIGLFERCSPILLIFHDVISNSSVIISSSNSKNKYNIYIMTATIHVGWDEGILKMSKGTRATLTCSADYAYGEVLLVFTVLHYLFIVCTFI